MKPKEVVTRCAFLWRRRGAAAVLFAVSLTMLMGFMALAVDVGVIYNTRAELQRAADAAALAAAAELGNQGDDPLARARAAAQHYANLNVVLGEGVGLDPATDVMFGTASINPDTNKYIFTPTEVKPNAIRVRLRRTQSSPTGPMPLFFARALGFNTADVSAQATAVLTPRDICFVLDLSLSHSFDSSLIHYRLTDVGAGLKNVWKFMHTDSSVGNLAENGPSFGNMNTWGSDTVDSSWDYAGDPGLTQLKRGASWNLTSEWTSQSLAAYRANQSATFQSQNPAAYTAAEMAVINAAGGAGTETSTSSSTDKANYRRRVLVALGIYRWKSGKAGGQVGGDGDNLIEANEIETMVPYPSSSSNPSTDSKQFGGSWDAFVDYVSDINKSNTITSDTGLTYRFLKYDPDKTCYGNPDLRWRFGLKTMSDYLQMMKYTANDSPGFAGAPQQPMGAVADGVKTAINYIKNLNGNDQIGMVGYGQIGYGPGDRPNHLSWLTTDFDSVLAKVDKLQSAIWTGNTNIPQGIDEAAGTSTLMGVLRDDAPNARDAAKKIIFLLTDGNANIVRSGDLNSPQNEAEARPDTIAAATDAAVRKPYRQNGCVIYTVSVGADADIELMEECAQIGKGQSYVANGDVAAYQAALQQIFLNLGGKRPVSLIE